MSRGHFAERARLSLFVVRRGVRRLAGRACAHPLLRLPFAGSGADRLLIAPQDLRTADPTRANDIYSGHFAFAGKVVVSTGGSPFTLPSPSPEWTEGLLGFEWLRHLRAADTVLTRSHARALIDDWIARQGRGDEIGWRPDVVARRVIAWLTHAPFLLGDADPRFYRRFLRSLSRQVGYLGRTAGAMAEGPAQLRAYIALAHASLCMAGQMRRLRPVGRRLADHLDRQILPDGGHASRNPGVILDLLLDLLPLRTSFAARNLPPPESVTRAIDRMMPMLRFFRHGDGHFVNFNGMGPTEPDLLAAVLAYDDARGRPVSNAVHSGYQRLEAGGLVLVMDTGRPPPLALSQDAHAGCLAFELSSGRHRIIVNCGLPGTGRDSWRQVARSTPAHSTMTLNDASSYRFLRPGRLHRMVGPLVIGGPEEVLCSREEDADGSRLWASHDGYVGRYGIVHERTVMLSADGRRLDGEDAMLPAWGSRLTPGSQDRFSLRFHLHPAVRAQRLTHRHAVLLTLPNRELWTFESYEQEVLLEQSVYLASLEGPRHTEQIVVRGRARDTPRLSWSFVHVDPVDARAIRRAEAAGGS